MQIIDNILAFVFGPKPVYRRPEQGEKVTFIKSNAEHMSTAYKGFTGFVHESDSIGFAIVNSSGSTLLCGMGPKKKTVVTYETADGTRYDACYTNDGI